jgi:hypothetical protein
MPTTFLGPRIARDEGYVAGPRDLRHCGWMKKPEQVPQDLNLRVRLLENSIQIALDNLLALKNDERFQNFLSKAAKAGS